MPTVRLSGSVLDPNDSARLDRAQLLFLLYNAGWDINNSNGRERITLSNIEERIMASDAFVFNPEATLEDMFKVVSIFVGYQTLDENLSGKPTVVLNTNASWDPLFALLSRMQELGTVKQDYRNFLLSATSPEAVIESLDSARSAGIPDAGRHDLAEGDEVVPDDIPAPADLVGNVCVFCSASLEDPSYIADGEALGRMLAENKYGCVSGAGKTGIMGAVVRGSVEAGGWTAGSNVPHIIKLEGLPEGLSQFWLRPDIYTRMEVMIENSDAFVIFPGGVGTVQELLALMIFIHQKDILMEGKPVIIFNRKDDQGVGFWDLLIPLLESTCKSGGYVVAETLDEILGYIDTALK